MPSKPSVPPDPPSGLPTAKEGFLAWAELAGLWSISVAYPLLMAGVSGSEGLTSLRADRLDVLAFVLLIVFVVPSLCLILEIVAGLVRTWLRNGLHAAMLGALAAVFVLRATEGLGQNGAVLTLLAAGIIAWAYSKFRFLKSMTRILAIGTPVVIAVFALSAPVSALFTPESAQEGELDPASSPPVVMLLLDEFPLASIERRQGEVDAQRFPNLSRLSRNSTWYTNARTPADSTVLAVPSLLTGATPGDPEIPSGAADYPDNLLTILDRAGYSVYGSEWVTDLCSHRACPRDRGFGARFARFLTNGLTYGRPVPLPGSRDLRVADKLKWNIDPRPLQDSRVDQFVREIQSGDHSAHFMHLMLPHVPWIFLPNGQRHNANLVFEEFTGPPNMVKAEKQQMLLQAQFLDRSLGRMIRAMKKAGTWDESLFVVVADHGASMEYGASRRVVAPETSGWILPVPLLIKYPGQDRGKVVGKTVSTADLTPTILDELGLRRSSIPGLDRENRSLESDAPGLRELDVDSTLADPFSISDSKVKRQLNEAIDKLRAEFPDDSLYAAAGHSELIGRFASRTPRLRLLPSSINQADLYEDVDLNGETIPAYVNGTIPGETMPDDTALAISLNGRVAGTTNPWQADSVTNFGSVVDPKFFRSGRNQIGLYRILPQGEHP